MTPLRLLQRSCGREFLAVAVAVAFHGSVAAAALAAPEVTPPGDEEDDDASQIGFVIPPDVELTPPLLLSGYIDVGYAKAAGNGTSYPTSDTRVPADYGVDPFSPAVNSRGEVASTDGGDVFVNGFTPRSVNAGGRGTFLLNTVNLDLKYEASGSPLMFFTRLQALPRFAGSEGSRTTVYVDQAFGRLNPIKGHELFVSFGKFDSVFGIEYLDRQAPIRTGITPSLIGRYTMSPSVGARVSYRLQIAALWSAVSLNASATNSGTFDEALKPSEVSLTGTPTGASRVGYELNLARFQLKLGGSGLVGPRNDQQNDETMLRMWGADIRIYFAKFTLSGERIHLDEDEGAGRKYTGLGTFPVSSGFHVRGYWGQLAYELSFANATVQKLALYGRYDERHAWFDGFRSITVDRFTVGLRADLWRSVVAKVEYLRNRERLGAPRVPNDVLTSSLVFYW